MNQTIHIISLLSLLCKATANSQPASYGVDISFPIQRNFLTKDGASALETSKAIFGNERVQTYSEFFSGCMYMYGPKEEGHLCHQHEEQRLKYNIEQPRKMTNYTPVGFKKTRVSETTWKMIRDFWEKQKQKIGHVPDGLHDEGWPPGNTYCNHWSSPTKLVSIREDENMTEAVYTEASNHLKTWIPHATSFVRSSIYGIRVYTSGSILAPHVDRDPLISSAIINVDQRGLVEPWPLEVYDHEGMAHNLTLEPGDMILYESHSVLHGRPFALQGDYYANIFVHFKPEFNYHEKGQTQTAHENQSDGEL